MSAIPAELIATSRLDLVPLRAGHADEMADVLADPRGGPVAEVAWVVGVVRARVP